MVLVNEPPRVLAIGAHPDDIELGAGGFIRRLVHECQADVSFLILTAGVRRRDPGDSYDPALRRREAVTAAAVLGVADGYVTVLDIPDCRLHEFGHEIIDQVESRLYGRGRRPRVNIVLTHSAEDTHADHRAAHESTLSAVRDFPGAVLCYQAPSTKPNGFRPTFFVRLDRQAAAHKTRALRAHASQRDRLFMSPARTAGMAANWATFLRLPDGSQLEAFEVYKSFF